MRYATWKVQNKKNTSSFGVCVVDNNKRETRMRERESIPHGGLESKQYSRSWSCSIGKWVMSAIVVASERRLQEAQEENKKRYTKNGAGGGGRRT